MRTLITILCVLAGGSLSLVAAAGGEKSKFENFVTRDGGRLMDGNRQIRFISFDIPNLHYIEDNMQFDEPNIFRFPTSYEANDALASINQMGGQVVRIYTLSIRKTNDMAGLPRHITGLGQWNEEAMKSLDAVFEAANRQGVRIIFPFVDNWPWWGGIGELAGFRGKARKAFFTDSQVKADYQQLVRTVLNRVNTRTGQRYKDDRGILAWELGNELEAPPEWVREMAAFVKQEDPHHLVAESGFTVPDCADVDIVQDHLYQGDPVKMLTPILQHAKEINGHKVYYVGEFGFTTTEGLLSVYDTVIENPAFSGAMAWAFRFHNQDGGFYWHIDHGAAGTFQSFYWPGFPILEEYDETRFMRLVREKAYRIQGLTPPPLAVPAPPQIISVTEGGLLNWRGSAGAANYDVQRSTSPTGPWETVGFEVDDAQIQYHPLCNDETAMPGTAYYYRVLARNAAGLSEPSRSFGPVTIRCRTFVDELANMARLFRKSPKLELRKNDCRNYKEDCHRLYGPADAWVSYHVPGSIISVKVFVFGDKDKPALELLAGTELAGAKLLQADAKHFKSENEMYKFRPPALFSLRTVPGKTSDVVIHFLSEAQLSRVEIEYTPGLQETR